MRPDVGMAPPHQIVAEELSSEYGGLINPLQAFMVKGWSRSLAAMTCMVASYESQELRDAWPMGLKRRDSVYD